MVSSTRQTERRRAMNHARAGAENKRQSRRTGTPKFPIHPEGLTPKASDAKKK